MEIAKLQEAMNKDQGIVCPACGHFAGVYENCPRCGTYLPKRTSLKFFKYFSLVLGIGGLFFLYLWILHRDLPKIQVKNITETMNFAYVQMSGTVTKEIRPFTDENKKVESLSFFFNDGTGEIRAVAYKQSAQKLLDEKKVPKKGDYIHIKGQLKVKADQNVTIMLQAADQLSIKRAQAKLVPLEKIGNDYINKDVAVVAKIESIRVPREGSKQPVFIELSSQGKTLPLVMWKDVYMDIVDNFYFEPGTMVYVNAFVNEHKDKLQLKLQQAQDFRLNIPGLDETKEEKKEGTEKLQESPFPKIEKANFVSEINKIKVEDKDKWFQLQGTIVDVRKFGMGLKLLVKDSTAKIEVILWNKTFEDAPVLSQLKNGVKIKVEGKVDVYREKIQLHPAQISQLEITGGDASQNAPGHIGEITREHIDQTLTLSGKVIQKIKVKPGFALVLEDKTGKIGAMLWDRIFKESKIVWEIDVDKWVQITGSINEHKGKLQIQPATEEDIKILSQAPADTPQKKPFKQSTKEVLPEKKPSPQTPETSLLDFKEVVPIPENEKNLEKAYLDFIAYTKKEHLGKIVPSMGQILKRETIENVGVKLIFQDRSGRIDLLLPQERFQNSPYYQKLAEGYEVWMQGKVIEFNGKLMLQPRGDADFKILALPKKEENKLTEDTSVENEDKELPLVKISEETVGQIVTIQGNILSLKDIKEGKKLVLEGNFGKIDVILANDIFSSTPLWLNIKEGNNIQVKGEVKKFKKWFEIKPDEKDAVQIVEKKKINKPTVETIEKIIEIAQIADIEKNEGKKVSLSAMVLECSMVPPGFEASLRDNSGIVKLFVKESLLTDLNKWQNCTPGSKIKLIAKVNKGRERIQLDLEKSEDLQVIEKGTFNPLEKPSMESHAIHDWVDKK